MTLAAIVIPSYNEAQRLPGFLAELCEQAKNHPNVLIIVSDDGSQLEHFRVVERVVNDLKKRYPFLQLHREEKNAGKGAAIARVFCVVESDIVGFIDADGSVSASECFRLLDIQVNELSLRQDKGFGAGASAVIGSRVKMLGRSVDRNLHRHLMGRVFATIVSTLFDIAVYDSQCGCKFFVREDFLKVVHHAHNQRWLWDTQLLISLVKAGFPVIEAPVSWHEVPGSKVSLLRDSWRMFTGLVQFKKYLEQEQAAGRFVVSSLDQKHGNAIDDAVRDFAKPKAS